MGQYGHRNMYYITGLPGWMRLGYSPGWQGRSATGLGPAAQYLTTGQWPTPQMAAWWSQNQGTAVAPANELQYLQQQAGQLKTELDSIQKRIEELEKK